LGPVRGPRRRDRVVALFAQRGSRATRAIRAGQGPAGPRISPANRPRPETFSRTYLLDRQAGLNGEYIVDARVGFDTSPAEKTRPYVQVTFNRTGAELLASMTAANVKKRMAIVLDGNVDSAPLIQTAIPGGICSIHLGGLKPVNEVLQEAKDLVLTLRGGALPVPLRLVSEERIEPRGKP